MAEWSKPKETAHAKYVWDHFYHWPSPRRDLCATHLLQICLRAGKLTSLPVGLKKGVELELPWRDWSALNGALAGAEKRNVLGRIFLSPLLGSDILTACLEDPATPAGERFHHRLSAWRTNTCTLTVEWTHEGGLVINSCRLFLWCRPGCTRLLIKHWP